MLDVLCVASNISRLVARLYNIFTASRAYRSQGMKRARTRRKLSSRRLNPERRLYLLCQIFAASSAYPSKWIKQGMRATKSLCCLKYERPCGVFFRRLFAH